MLMIKRVFCFVMLINVSAQYAMAVIDEQQIVGAQKTITQELAHTYRRRKVATVCIAAAVCAVPAYMLGRWLVSRPKKDTGAPCSQEQDINLNKSGKLADSAKDASGSSSTKIEVPKIGYREWALRGIKSMGVETLKWIPYLAVSTAVSGMILPWTNKSIKVLDRFYKSLDWHWMIIERTRLPRLLGVLQSLAAALDPKSAIFDSMSGVNVTIPQREVMMANGLSLRMGEFDELIGLRACAQPETHIDRSLYERQLQETWTLIVDALVQCFGFMAYRDQESQTCVDVWELDRHQLASVRNQMIEYTNAVAQQLPDLMRETTMEKTGGLLALVRHYCNYINRHCGILETNQIVGSYWQL